MWLLLPLLLTPLLATLTVQLDLIYDERLHRRITTRLLGWTHTWKGRRKSAGGAPQRKRRYMALLTHPPLRRFALRHIRIVRLDGLVSLHAGDAAASALIAGALDAIGRIPAIRHAADIRVLPDFFRGRTQAQGFCIIQAKLGMLIIIIIAAYLRHKEEYAWNIPSAN